MKKLKKLLIGALSFVLGAALTLVGTLAYLQDETDTAFNVQTVGSVYIEQYELERKGNEFVAFTKGKPADPAVYNAGNTEPIYADAALNWEGLGSKGANKLFADSIGNVVDHIVFVKNTGSNDAYIRTVIAIETPVGFDANKIHKNVNTDGITWETINNVDIDGVNYTVLVATYNEAVEGGKATAPSLLQLYLDPTTGNKDTALFGDTWDVLVVSQAMQTTGVSTPGADAALDVAFGNITATNTPWTRENDPQDATPPYVANTAEEFAGFLANGGSIVIAEDITIGSSMSITKDTVLDLNGMTIDAAGTISGCPIMLKNGKLVVKNGTLNLEGAQTNVNGTYYTAIGYDANTELVVDNVTFKGATAINGTWNSDGPLKLTISNSTFDVNGSGIVVSAGSTEAYAIINNCNVNAGEYAIFASQGSKVTVNGGNYSADTVITSMYAGTEITVNGGYFDGDLWITNDGSLVVKGGTFTADPSAYVADGYVVVEGTTYARSATTTYTVLPIADETTFRLAMEKLDNIKLMGNISLDADDTITIAENTTKEIDLNDFTLGGISDDADKNDDGKLTSDDNEVMFDVRGTLTVKDGQMVYEHKADNFGWNACTELFYVAFNGVLNVENVIMENLGGSDMAYCIDLVNATNVTLNVTDSTLKSSYIPVRVFNNGAGKNNVTIEGTKLIGTSRAFWVHIYSSKDNGGKGIKDATLNLDIYGNENTFVASNPNRIIEFGFDDEINFDAEGNLIAGTAEALVKALANGGKVVLVDNINADFGIELPEGATIDGNGYSITYGIADDYHLVRLNTGATVKNLTLNNYRVRTEDATNGVVTLENVTINMDNDLTGLDISRGAGTAKLTNVVCKGTKDAAHLDPNTQVQVDYTPYGDVLLGTKWALEANGCDFGSLHGWNTTNGSSVSLNNTTYTVFRMHYWNNRTLYINGVETAWADSGAIPVAHDVGGCWSVQPAFK